MKKMLFTIILFGTSLQFKAQSVIDTRITNEAPTSYNTEVKYEFKARGAIGVPGVGYYSGLMTFAPWADNSGGMHHQLNFNDGGVFYRTGLPDNSSWNSWTRLLITDLDENLTLNGVLKLFGGEDSNDDRIYFQASDQSNRFVITTDLDYTTLNDVLKFRTASSDNALVIKGSGNVGIGRNNPDGKLDIFGNQGSSTNLILSANYENSYRWRFNTIDRGNAIDIDITASDSNDSQEAVLKLSRSTSGRPEFQLFDNSIVANNGNVGIGTADTKGFKLGVQGKIAAEEVKVAIYNNWADFVFEKNYNLPTLKEVEQHIKEKGHLKDIPSAEHVKENGIFLGEMDSKLLQKIEELTLYSIDQEKRIETLEAKNEKLMALLEELLNKKD